MIVGSCCIHSPFFRVTSTQPNRFNRSQYFPKCRRYMIVRSWVSIIVVITTKPHPGTQMAGADTKSRPSTASGATGWLRSGSLYRWSLIPCLWSTHQFDSICYDLAGFVLGWVAWNHPISGDSGVHVIVIHRSNRWPCRSHHKRYC